jgi:hypothetical protein
MHPTRPEDSSVGFDRHFLIHPLCPDSNFRVTWNKPIRINMLYARQGGKVALFSAQFERTRGAGTARSGAGSTHGRQVDGKQRRK